MVMMCSDLVWLMLFSTEASVVDFPDPVGPVTKTSPRGERHTSSRIDEEPRSVRLGMLLPSARKQAA